MKIGRLVVIISGLVVFAGTVKADLNEALPATQESLLNRATASGSILLDSPESQLLNIADIPSIAKTCRGRTNWWLPIVIQIGLTTAYLIWQKPTVIERSLAWLLAISVASYFTYAIIGCACSRSQVCSWYFAINLAILFTGGGWVYIINR